MNTIKDAAVRFSDRYALSSAWFKMNFLHCEFLDAAVNQVEDSKQRFEF